MYYRIWFSRIEISNRIKIKLLEKYTEKELYFLEKDVLENFGLKQKEIEKILDENLKGEYNNKLIKIMEEEKIRCLRYTDNEYPYILSQIPDFPVYLFVKGNLNILNNESYAIVGSRKASLFGVRCANAIAYNIAKDNINVVSGLALGIDAAAHLGALRLGYGKTIAVLGNGLLEEDFYPKENLNIYREILNKEGAIVSEYIIFTKPNKYHFPARNRIISGLSSKIIVVEAAEKSGSLITVDFALEQGRDVYAVPGNICDLNSKGTNKLIKEGAKVLTEYEDLKL